MPSSNEDIVIAIGLYVLQVHNVIPSKEEIERESLSCSIKDKILLWTRVPQKHQTLQDLQ